MSTLFLKRTTTVVTPILTHLFGLSLVEGVFPGVLKTNKTIPIFKKGPRHGQKLSTCIFNTGIR